MFLTVGSHTDGRFSILFLMFINMRIKSSLNYGAFLSRSLAEDINRTDFHDRKRWSKSGFNLLPFSFIEGYLAQG